MLDTDEHDPAAAWATAHGLRLQLCQDAALRARAPSLSTRFKAGLWLPEVAQVRSPRLMRALRASLDQRGIAYREGLPVKDIVVDNGRALGVETIEGVMRADKVVITSGAWSSGLLPGGAANPTIEPVRGQMIAFQAKPGRLERLILYRGRYIIPRRDGLILAGSTLEYAGYDKRITKAAFKQLRAAALEMMPTLGDCPIAHHWAGLRPGSPLGIPTIGEHPAIRGLFINAGHFRYGILFAPASVRLLLDVMLDRTPAYPPAPYRLESESDRIRTDATDH